MQAEKMVMIKLLLFWLLFWYKGFLTDIKVKPNFSQQLLRQKCFIIWVLFQRLHMWNKLFYLLHSRRHGVTWLTSRWWLAACGWLG